MVEALHDLARAEAGALGCAQGLAGSMVECRARRRGAGLRLLEAQPNAGADLRLRCSAAAGPAIAVDGDRNPGSERDRRGGGGDAVTDPLAVAQTWNPDRLSCGGAHLSSLPWMPMSRVSLRRGTGTT